LVIFWGSKKGTGRPKGSKADWKKPSLQEPNRLRVVTPGLGLRNLKKTPWGPGGSKKNYGLGALSPTKKKAATWWENDHQIRSTRVPWVDLPFKKSGGSSEKLVIKKG